MHRIVHFVWSDKFVSIVKDLILDDRKGRAVDLLKYETVICLSETDPVEYP
jgi:hypothetical protein